MKKLERQAIIRDLIQTHQIETQEELSQHLLKLGVVTTQATLSRDIREMGIIKSRFETGSFYTLFDYETGLEQGGNIPVARNLMDTISAYALTVRRAQFILVIHTGLGEADMVADAIDTAGRSDILGTIAGADTLFVTCQDEISAVQFESDIRDAIQQS